MTESGEHLETVRISNDRDYLREVMARAGETQTSGTRVKIAVEVGGVLRLF